MRQYDVRVYCQKMLEIVIIFSLTLKFSPLIYVKKSQNETVLQFILSMPSLNVIQLICYKTINNARRSVRISICQFNQHFFSAKRFLAESK